MSMMIDEAIAGLRRRLRFHVRPLSNSRWMSLQYRDIMAPMSTSRPPIRAASERPTKRYTAIDPNRIVRPPITRSSSAHPDTRPAYPEQFWFPDPGRDPGTCPFVPSRDSLTSVSEWDGIMATVMSS